MGYIVPYLGIDLGTSNTQIYVRHKGIVIDEPSILVADRNAKRTVRAIGDDARVMLGRTTGDSMAVRPLADGLTHDFDMTEEMLRYFVRKAIGASRLFRPRAVMTVPSRITPVERRVLRKAAVSAGIRENQLNLVEKSFAAALVLGIVVPNIELQFPTLNADITHRVLEYPLLPMRFWYLPISNLYFVPYQQHR